MNQFQVPQFITVEDKVFGPFTIKQFLYLASGGLLIVGARLLLLPVFFYPLAALIGGVAASFAFLKINERPFPEIFKSAVFFYLKPRLYIWRKEEIKKEKAAEIEGEREPFIKTLPRLSESKLTDLAWSLDIKSKR